MLLHVLLLFPYEAWAVDSLMTMSTEHIWDRALVECWRAPWSSGCSEGYCCLFSGHILSTQPPRLRTKAPPAGPVCRLQSEKRAERHTIQLTTPSFKRWSVIFAAYIVCSTNSVHINLLQTFYTSWRYLLQLCPRGESNWWSAPDTQEQNPPLQNNEQ